MLIELLFTQSDEIDVERSKRRLIEDDLSATRIRLKRAEKLLEVEKSDVPSNELKGRKNIISFSHHDLFFFFSINSVNSEINFK